MKHKLNSTNKLANISLGNSSEAGFNGLCFNERSTVNHSSSGVHWQICNQEMRNLFRAWICKSTLALVIVKLMFVLYRVKSGKLGTPFSGYGGQYRKVIIDIIFIV